MPARQDLLNKQCVDQMPDSKMTCPVSKTLCQPIICRSNYMFCRPNILKSNVLSGKWHVQLAKHCVYPMPVGQMTSSVDQTLCWSNAWHPNDMFCWQSIVLTNACLSNDEIWWPNVVPFKCLLAKWQFLLTNLCNDKLHFGRMTCSIDQALFWSNAWNPRACSVGKTFCHPNACWPNDKLCWWNIQNACWSNDKLCWPKIVSIKSQSVKWKALLVEYCVIHPNVSRPDVFRPSVVASVKLNEKFGLFEQVWKLNYRDESFEVKIVKRNLLFFRIKNKVYCQSDSSTKHDNFHQALYYGGTTFIITTFSIVSDTQHNRLNCDTEHWRHLLRSVLLCSVTHFLIDMLRVIIPNAVMLSVVGPVQ